MLDKDNYKRTYNQEVNSNAIKELLVSPDNKYHLTLAPVQGQNINTTIKSFNKFLHILNTYLYGKRYKNKNKHLNGIVVMESAERHNPHFHMIIRDPNGDLEDRFPLEEAIAITLPKITLWTCTNGTDKREYKFFVDSKCWCLQKYENDGDDCLEEYLSKEAQKSGHWHNDPMDNIGILHIDGVDFAFRENVIKDVRYRDYATP